MPGSVTINHVVKQKMGLNREDEGDKYETLAHTQGTTTVIYFLALLCAYCSLIFGENEEERAIFHVTGKL